MVDKIPRLISNVDVRTFKLDPTDGFVIARIDGRLGLKALALETGLPEFSVERSLDKLEQLGLIERVDPTASVAPPPATSVAPPPATEPEYDPIELEEVCDLPLEQKRRILDLYYRLDDLDHYMLLGVSADADKKSIKRAYFELAALTHPDRYFKKNLGSFQPKMTALFARITEAHDMLVDRDKRAEYDTYLREVAATRGMEATIARAQTVSVSSPPPDEIRARKEALARRLLGGQTRSSSSSSLAAVRPSSPEVPKFASSADAVDALKRRYEERAESAMLAQARKYTQSAEESLAKGDLVAAASAFGIATKFAPNDSALAARFQETRTQASVILIESYIKQAEYEERNQHWAEAARTWQKVVKIQANHVRANAGAARALFQADDGDLHQAAEHAKKAIASDPSIVASHVILAEIYLKAGLVASARRAAEAGLNVDSANAMLQGIVARAAKTAKATGG